MKYRIKRRGLLAHLSPEEVGGGSLQKFSPIKICFSYPRLYISNERSLNVQKCFSKECTAGAVFTFSG